MISARRSCAFVAAIACAAIAAAPATADVTSPVTLPYAQAWSDSALITSNDDWSGVAGVQGYLGDVDAGSPVDVDARTVTADATTTDVVANVASPNTLTAGGVAELAVADPVVALQGSGTADAPNVAFRVDATARQNVTLAFDARDVDGSADSAVQQIAVQYRVGTSGAWTRSAWPPRTATSPTPRPARARRRSSRP